MTTGIDILQRILGKTGSSRESILLSAFTTEKAIPAFLNTFIPIHAHGQDTSGNDIIIEYLVASDYLSLGTDDNFLRVPLLPGTAQKVATSLNCILPTKHMVDQIYQGATVFLSPQTIQPKAGEPGRDDSRTYEKHNQLIQTQLGSRTYIGLLTAGHKKDIVISNQLLRNPGKVAIYGWHQRNGTPIQPLFLGHGDFYVDYSHGIRLISKVCRVNGVQRDLEEVLRDGTMAHLLTGEGPLQITRYP